MNAKGMMYADKMGVCPNTLWGEHCEQAYCSSTCYVSEGVCSNCDGEWCKDCSDFAGYKCSKCEKEFHFDCKYGQDCMVCKIHNNVLSRLSGWLVL